MSLDKAILKLSKIRRKVKNNYPEAYKVVIETSLDDNEDFLPRVTVYCEESEEEFNNRLEQYKNQQEMFKQARYNYFLQLKKEYESE